MGRKIQDKKSLDWKPENWREFLEGIRNDCDNATEQWNEDCREELVKRFHLAVFKVIEDKFSGDEWFEEAVLEELRDDWLPKNIEGFSDLGEVLLSISEDSIEAHQRNLIGRQLDEFVDNKKRSEIPASQKTLLDEGAK